MCRPLYRHEIRNACGHGNRHVKAAVPNAVVVLEDTVLKASHSATSDSADAYSFADVAPGTCLLHISARGFAPWRIKDVIIVHEAEDLRVPEVQLGVEATITSVNAITIVDLAEEQITAEKHQRIWAYFRTSSSVMCRMLLR